jgi:hypothetical protein
MAPSAGPGALHSTRPGRRLALALGALALAIAAAPLPVAAADPSPSPTPTAASTPAPRSALVPSSTLAPGPSPSPPSVTLAATTRRTIPKATLAPLPTPAYVPTRVLIHRESAMVKQYTNYWCVPATTQSMLNLILGTSDRTKATQERYYKGTRKNNRYTYATKGNDPQGWAWSLRYYSGGRTTYQARSFTNKTASLNAIVESIDRTGSPVGVPVHDGTHAWIVLGYKAAPDPDDPSKRIIQGFYVSGPLGSPTDPWTYEYMSNSTFRTHFTKYHEWQRDVIWEGTWVIISQ